MTGSEAYPVSFPIGMGALSSLVKELEHEADHSLPNCYKNVDIYIHSPMSSRHTI
jgi:hypothetical protein